MIPITIINNRSLCASVMADMRQRTQPNRMAELAPIRRELRRATSIDRELRDAATTLREAQRAYMADRGNNALGAVVGQAAAQVDDVLARWDAHYGD